MKKFVFVLMLLAASALAQSAPAAATNVSPEDAAAIRATALNYVEGWYAGDAERMASALHPELVKRIMNVDPQTGRPRLDGMGKSALVEGTRRGFGKETPAAEQQKDVQILDVYQNAASVRATMRDWIDYMHMVKWEGKWVIVNVLWERKPKPAAATK
jgi:hypothetical protein